MEPAPEGLIVRLWDRKCALQGTALDAGQTLTLPLQTMGGAGGLQGRTHSRQYILAVCCLSVCFLTWGTSSDGTVVAL